MHQSGAGIGRKSFPFFAYPLEVRKVIKNRGHFPNDEAALKLIYLALRNITKKWKMPPITWRAAKTQFAILFGARFTGFSLRMP